eukprot:6396054-Prymnesium_polylepis.4
MGVRNALEDVHAVVVNSDDLPQWRAHSWVAAEWVAEGGGGEGERQHAIEATAVMAGPTEGRTGAVDTEERAAAGSRRSGSPGGCSLTQD